MAVRTDSEALEVRGAPSCELLIRRGHVLTMDDARTVFSPGAVAIAGGRIVAVGSDDSIGSQFSASQTIDAGGSVVHPGLVDAHYHVTMHTTRGAIADRPASTAGDARASFGGFIDWFNAQDDADEFASAQLACLEMARNGVTCFMDPGTAFAPDAVADAAERVGVRASVSDAFLWDVEGGLAMASQIGRAPASLSRSLDALGGQLSRNSRADALVRGHVSVYGSGSASPELELAAKAAADTAGVTFTQHQSLDARDAAFDRERFGEDPLVHLARCGVLGENTSFMHMNVLTPAERSTVAESGMTVIWHPGNFLYYGISASGPSPVPELIDKGVAIALATDLAKAWTFAETGWLGYLVARMSGGYISAAMVLEASTRGGARSVGMEDMIGSLEVGKRADVVIRRDDLPEAQPGIDVEYQLVLVSRTKSVKTVIVDGKVVIRDGEAVTVDPQQVFEEARLSARRMLAKVA